jgi:hypothetical protein
VCIGQNGGAWSTGDGARCGGELGTKRPSTVGKHTTRSVQLRGLTGGAKRMRRQQIVLCAAVLMMTALAGCGGGGGGAGRRGYTPPENVMPKTVQAQRIGQVMVSSVDEAGSAREGPAGATGLPHVDAVDRMLNEVFADELTGIVGGASANNGPPSAGYRPLALLVRLARSQVTAGQAEEDECETVPVEWEDPLCGTAWTGTVTRCPMSLTAHVEGRGEGTLMKVDLAVTQRFGGATAELTVKGTAPQTVRHWDVASQSDVETDGRVTVDGQARADVGIGALGSLAFELRARLTYEEQIEEDGAWTTVRKGSARVDAHGSSPDGQQVSMEGTFDFTEAEKVGEGFLEMRSGGTFEASGRADGEGWETFAAVANADGSNSMRGYLRIEKSGEVSGWVRDAEGRTIATLRGSLAEGIQVCVEGGECRPLE